MSSSIDDLRKLPVAERLELLDSLWESIFADSDPLLLSDQQAAELDRRLAEHEANPGESVSWQELRDRLLGGR